MKTLALALAGLCVLAAMASAVLIVMNLRLERYDLVAACGLLVVLQALCFCCNLAAWLAP